MKGPLWSFWVQPTETKECPYNNIQCLFFFYLTDELWVGHDGERRWSKAPWAWIWAPSTSPYWQCDLSKVFNLLNPELIHLWNGENDSTYKVLYIVVWLLSEFLGWQCQLLLPRSCAPQPQLIQVVLKAHARALPQGDRFHRHTAAKSVAGLELKSQFTWGTQARHTFSVVQYKAHKI